jgi:hypothetical protein
MAWKDLSVKDRAGFIRQMVSLGITKPKDQELFYDNSISGPGKRQTFNPTKPKYTTLKTVGYNKIPLEGQQLDKYNDIMDQQIDNIVNATGVDYETAFKMSGYDPNKYVPIKHNFIKKADGGRLFDKEPIMQLPISYQMLR